MALGGGTQVGQAEIVLRLRDESLKRELTQAERQVLQTVKRIDKMRGEAEIDADISAAEKRMRFIENRIRDWDRRRAEATATVDIKRAQAKLAALNAELSALDRRRVSLNVELSELRDADRQLGSFTDRVVRAGREVEHTDGLFRRWGRNIANMTLRLGPFSASLRQFAIALVALGPVLSGITAGLSALAGALSTGLVGATVGLGTALTGLTVIGIGLGATMKRVKEDFDSIQSAQDSYRSAVLRYGRGSEQAAKKLEQLRKTLKGVGPVAREAFLGLRQMGKAWREMTKPAREALLDTMGNGLATLQKLMPQFASRTNEAAGIVQQSFNRMFSGIRSREGRAAIDEIFANANTALVPFLAGLTQLAAAFGKVVRVASRFLPSFAGDFAGWATEVNRSADNSEKLERKLRELNNAARATGRFFMAAGRLIVAFFGRGAKPGIGIMDRLTESMNNATESIRDGELDKWFGRAGRELSLIWGTLRPLLQAFGNFITLAAPFSEAMLRVTSPLAELLNTILDFGPARNILQALTGFFLAGKAAKGIGGIFRGGVAGLFGKRGASPTNPLFVADVTGGFGKGRGFDWKKVFAGGAMAVRVLGPVALAGTAIAALSAAVNRNLPTEGGAEIRRSAANRPGLTPPGEAFRRAPDPFRGKGHEGLAATAAGAEQLNRRIRAVRAEIKKLRDESGRDVGQLAEEASNRFKQIRDSIGLHTAAGRRLASDNFAATARVIAREMQGGRASTNRGMSAIKELMRTHSGAGKEAMQRNMARAIDAVRNTMQQGGRVTRQGMQVIRNLMVQELKFYGLSPKQAINISKGDGAGGLYGDPDRNLGREGGALRRARGGFLPGMGQQDTVPVLAAPGEAFLTKHQQVPVEVALRNTFGVGLDDLFAQQRRPHFMARGGRIPGTGGNIIGLGHALQRMGYHVGEHPAFGGVAPVHAHYPPHDHYSGGALDINADHFPGGEMGALDRLAGMLRRAGWNVLWRVADHFDHLHVDTRNGGGGLMTAVAKAIKRVKVGGRRSPLRSVVQGALDATRAGANRVLQNVSMFGGGDTGPVSGGFSKARLARLWIQAGGDPKQAGLMAAIALAESGGNPSARNPSGASGLWQILGLPFPGNPFDPLTNARMAVAKYRSQGLGAWEAYTKGMHVQFMKRGGRVPGWIRRAMPWMFTDKGRRRGHDDIVDLMSGGQFEDFLSLVELRRSRATLTPGTLDDRRQRSALFSLLGFRSEGIRGRIGSIRESLRTGRISRADMRRLRGERKGRVGTIRQSRSRIKQINRALGRKKNKPSTEARSRLSSERTKLRNRIEENKKRVRRINRALKNPKLSKGQRRRLRAELRTRRGDLGAVYEQIGGLREEATGEVDPRTAFFEAVLQQRSDAIDAQGALAALTPGLDDDRAAASARVLFLEELLRAARANGDNAQIATVATDLKAARDNLAELNAPTVDESAVLEQTKAKLRIAQSEAAINAAFARVAGGPGDIGTGNFASGRMAAIGGRGGATVIINTLHPGDPATLQAIGAAASAGFGYQGYVSSPRSFSGV